MLMGLSLLSQPAQALNWNFSYTNNSGNSFTGTLISDGSSAATNTIYNLTGISGTVTNNGISALVSAISPYNTADNKFVWDGGTAIALTVNGISFTDANAQAYNVYSGGGGTGTALSDFSTNSLAVQNTAGTNGTVTSSSLTPATAVPWETDALPVIGSTILFAGGLWAKRKFAKPLQK
jgi:hypothetical protein